MQSSSQSGTSTGRTRSAVVWFTRDELLRGVNDATRTRKVRTWWFHGNLVSAKVGRELWRARWTRTWDEHAELEDAARSAGLTVKSSYSSFWHQRARSMRESKSTVTAFSELGSEYKHPAAWQEARAEGTLNGDWNVFDLKSAYAWAVSRSLPNMKSTVHVLKPTMQALRGERIGLYLMTDGFPYAQVIHPRFKRKPPWWITAEELALYDFKGRAKFAGGFEWLASIDLRRHLDWFQGALPEKHYKQVFRAFWGSWIQTTGVVERIFHPPGVEASSRELPCFRLNRPWGWDVMASVALRCAEYADRAARVYVDSVIVPSSLSVGCGNQIGDWRLKTTIQSPRIENARDVSTCQKVRSRN